jgi:DsbC/DsbD-like thiol-disulfide interchange protein
VAVNAKLLARDGQATYISTMNRRSLLFTGIATILSASAVRAEQPWQARLLKGGFDGSHYRMGLHITMAEHWKTYWRVPGSGGVAPQIDVKASNLKSFTISYPLPKRFEDASGESIGFKGEVVFPVAIAPLDATKPLEVSVDAFFGICEVVCIPAQFNGTLSFSSSQSDAPDQLTLNQWQNRVPVSATQPPILSAKVEQQSGKLYLLLETGQALQDIFVEGSPQHYFGKPNLMRGLARLAVSGAKDPAELRGQNLRITVDDGALGLEQFVTVV